MQGAFDLHSVFRLADIAMNEVVADRQIRQITNHVHRRRKVDSGQFFFQRHGPRRHSGDEPRVNEVPSRQPGCIFIGKRTLRPRVVGKVPTFDFTSP